MPKTRVKEQDFTGVIQRSPISNIVYIPIRTTESIPFVEKGKVKGLYSSKKAFVADFGTKISAKKESINAYNIACHLLELGFQILAEGVSYADGATEEIEIDVDRLKDKGLVDIRFLTAGYLSDKLNAQIVEIAEARQDCIALINLNEVAATFEYVVYDEDPDNPSIRKSFSEFTDKIYCAGFTPWFTTVNSTLADEAVKDEDGQVVIPAAYGYLFAYGRMLANGIAEWKAVAGPERGVISELTDVCYNYNAAEIEILQSRAADGAVDLDAETDNVGFAINPIANIRPNGYIIYGNRTLKNNDAIKKTTAQSFLNIRNGVNAIKKVLYDASRKFVFEQNTEVLWINFKNYVTPLLEKMLSGEGILGYTFVRVQTDAKARLKARLTVIPVEAVEDFDIEIDLVDDLTVTE